MIKYPKTFEEARPANFDGIFDWDFILPAFKGTKIEPMDIDGIIERHGRILLFETKSPGKGIPLGQQITLNALLALGRGRIHLMIIYGKTPESIEALEEWHFNNGQVTKGQRKDCNAEFVLKRVSDWFHWANSKEGIVHD